MTNTQTYTFEIQGMDCAGCARTLEKGVGQLAGVTQCEINFTTEKMTLAGNVSREAVIAQVRQLGYDVKPDRPDGPLPDVAPPNFLQFMWQRTDTRLALLGALLILPGLLLVEIGGQELAWVNLLSVAAMIAAGWPIARSAWTAVRLNREININVLMTVAAVGAVLIGAYTEAGMVMVLFAIGEALEGYTAGRARHAIRSLMAVAPQEATRLLDGRPQRIPIQELHIGDVILVKPGERVAMDGRVRSGSSALDQAPITGESLPVDKEPGDIVFAGSINGAGALEVEVTHLAADNTISRIIQMVEEAQEKKAPAERFVDRFARIYTPAVMVLALLVATVPPLFFGQPFLNEGEAFGWLYRGLALLVVACPCALVLSTPVAIVSAISNGARHGVLFKGGAFVEALSRVQAIAFDKTGTLTQGKPAVVALRTAVCDDGSCADCNDLLALAGAVEQQSEHPLAQAIVQETAVRGLDQQFAPAMGVMALTGQGVTGQVNGRTVTIGSHTYFEANVPHTDAACEQARDDAAQGFTPLLVSVDGRYQGTISVADTVRPDSPTVLRQLQAAGIAHTIMLTGDQAAVAQAIAQTVGVTDMRAELMPGDKVTAVRALQQQFGKVAMVGDGINDAPALAAADVGIAIGGAGATAQAMETADITLMSDGLKMLPFAYRLSRAAMNNIRFNVAFAIGVKFFFVLLVLAGQSTMWMAVAADMGTSLLVTLNGMRLLRFK
ncbi:MAG: cadmium-translocating P-type ATPase [Anaerolineae bacterium]|nr:cadmium-translocating P-type ATPase [Anaerolineae bacterium]